MIDHWEGAQWVLASYLIGKSINPIIFRLAGITLPSSHHKELAEWLGEYLANILGTALLVAVLWWGGFWS